MPKLEQTRPQPPPVMTRPPGRPIRHERTPAQWQQMATAMALPLSRLGYGAFAANRGARKMSH
jgi:hypothetical protein